MEAQGNRTQSELPSGTPRESSCFLCPFGTAEAGGTHPTLLCQTRGTPHVLSRSSISSVSCDFFCGRTLGLFRALVLRVSRRRNVSSSAPASPSRELAWICDEKLVYARKGACRDPLSSHFKCKPSGRCCWPHPALLNCFLLSMSQTE